MRKRKSVCTCDETRVVLRVRARDDAAAICTVLSAANCNKVSGALAVVVCGHEIALGVGMWLCIGQMSMVLRCMVSPQDRQACGHARGEVHAQWSN